ncbi:MAG TPA: hypothetical protein D7I06_09000, partial [Candidatus Poseidoniales archaeon]
WVREGDLIVVWPWDFQDSKADVKHRYTKTQAIYLSRKGVLPSDVDIFGMNVMADDFDDEDGLFSAESASNQSDDEPETPSEPENEESSDTEEDDDDFDDLFD